MIKTSAGVLAWRKDEEVVKVLLVHPGGPFFAKKDEGSWTIPKGECADGEDLLETAKREFEEELGAAIEGEFVALSPVKQKGGKVVFAWAIATSFDTSGFRSDNFTMEWPPKSGKKKEFPEVDRAEWFTIVDARKKINAAQVAFIDELEALI
jgi:predicted NUDIX family NTP pyrophosphohydrolase